jgi:hypothetical protein
MVKGCELSDLIDKVSAALPNFLGTILLADH